MVEGLFTNDCKKALENVFFVTQITLKRMENQVEFNGINVLNVIRIFQLKKDQKDYKIKFLKSIFIKDKLIMIQPKNMVNV